MVSGVVNCGSFGRVRRLMLASSGLLGLWAATPAMAESAGQAVEEVVVTAPHYVPTHNSAGAKTDALLVETPQSVSVIPRDQIEILNWDNIQQAVRYTAGAVGENYGPDQRYDWLTVRGFSPVQYIDGLQAPVGSVGNTGLDLWGVDSVEILKGPSSVLYGEAPPGGIVNLTTRRPLDHFAAEVKGLYGSYDNKQLAGDVTGPVALDGALSARLTGLWFDRGTQTDGVSSKRIFVAPSLTWKIDDATALTLLAYYQKDRVDGDGGGFLPAQGTLLPNPNGRIPVGFNAGEPGYNYFHREQYGVGYQFDHTFNEAFSVHQNLKYSTNDAHFRSIYGVGLEADLRTLDRSNFLYPEALKQFAVDTRAEAKFATGGFTHVAIVGLDYRDLKNDTGFGYGAGPTLDVFNPVYGSPIPALSGYFNYIHEDQKQTGLYAQDEMKAGGWVLTLGGRQDWLDTRDFGVGHKDDKFTGRVGVNYVTSFGLAPYIAYATSFQPTSGSDFAGNLFKPSTGRQAEAGVKFEPNFLPRDVHAFASAAVYELTQANVLTDDPAHLFMSVQTGEVRVKGFELEGVARIHERISLNGSYTYTDSEVTKSNGVDLGKRLPVTPLHKASLFADYTFQTGPLAGLGVGLGGRYLSSSYGDAANTPSLETKGLVLFDAIVHYDVSNWRVALNANNMFDKIYLSRCSAITQCFYGSRRDVSVSLSRKW
jgi:iron complex outermembrane receptor protein